MPNQPKTPRRTFRISDEIYLATRKKVAEDGANITELIKEAMLQYLSGEWEPW